MDTDLLSSVLNSAKVNKIANYIIPGLDSYLFKKGNVRLFECSREHQESVVPHSHRFDLVCIVLTGYVTNIMWTEDFMDGAQQRDDCEYDLFQSSYIEKKACYSFGQYQKKKDCSARWRKTSTRFDSGDVYILKYNEIHSINFSKGAKVLIIEGEERCSKSRVLEPIVDGKVIPTFEVKDWMFQEGDR